MAPGMTVNKELQLELCPCYDCSTIEGESELSSSKKHRTHIQEQYSGT